MTGAGTQPDPFRPTNWDEFVTAIGQSDVHIECPENGVWDMNEMLPEGMMSNAKWAGNVVNGNGLTINNLNFNGGFFSFSDSTHATDICKLNFLNMSTSGNHAYMFYTNDTSSLHAGNKACFQHCKFSGLISRGKVFHARRQEKMLLTHDSEKSCSLNFKFTGNGTLCDSDAPHFSYCNIKFDGETMASVSSSATTYEKCFISGKSPFNELKIYGYDNILDIEIPEGKQISTASYSNSHINTSVINVDKMHGSYTNTSYKYIEATTEQLSDAAYLQSKGFSIAG